MRILLATAALTLALASPASAEFFPVKQPSFVCDDTPDPTSASGTSSAVCAQPRLVPVTRAQVKLIVAYKVRAVWGRYAARHIRRYGCDLYRMPDEIGQRSTSCGTRFVSRRHRTVTRQLILSYGPAGPGVVGVTVRRFPKDETGPGTTPTGPGPTPDPGVTTEPTSTMAGPAIPSDG